MLRVFAGWLEHQHFPTPQKVVPHGGEIKDLLTDPFLGGGKHQLCLNTVSKQFGSRYKRRGCMNVLTMVAVLRPDIMSSPLLLIGPNNHLTHSECKLAQNNHHKVAERVQTVCMHSMFLD